MFLAPIPHIFFSLYLLFHSPIVKTWTHDLSAVELRLRNRALNQPLNTLGKHTRCNLCVSFNSKFVNDPLRQRKKGNSAQKLYKKQPSDQFCPQGYTGYSYTDRTTILSRVDYNCYQAHGLLTISKAAINQRPKTLSHYQNLWQKHTQQSFRPRGCLLTKDYGFSS